MHEPCQWHACLKEAETHITLKGGSHEPRIWKFCYDHYLEALTIAELLRRLTGMPEILEEGKYERNAGIH